AQVQLIDLTSGSVIARTQTDDKGYYQFPPVGSGFYLVRFTEDSDAGSPNFNMALEVDDRASLEHPPAFRATVAPDCFFTDGTDGVRDQSSSRAPHRLTYPCAVEGAGLRRARLPPANWLVPPDGNRSRLFLGSEKQSCFGKLSWR